MEKACYRPDGAGFSAAALGELIREVFASLDERPRPLELELDLTAVTAGATLELGADGEVLVTVGGLGQHVALGGRYLAEHAVPLKFKAGRSVRLRLTPTTGNRVKVRA